MNTPVLFLVFNRPNETFKVFEQIRLAKPKQLFIAADGPRSNKKDERTLCEQTRSVVELIDWDCDVRTLFRDENLGCGRAVSSAIDWFFETVEEGIILEDDCLPDPTFFSFCSELLDYYRDNDEIMHISGSNHQLGHWRGDGSYYFSNFVHIWGWATWRRAWTCYDFECKALDGDITQKLPLIPRVMLKQTIAGKIDTWDFQWYYAVKKQNGIGIIPNMSLVKNIGYDINSTHTNKIPSWFLKMKYGKIAKIIHPENSSIDVIADKFSEKTLSWDSFKAYILPTYLTIKKYFK